MNAVYTVSFISVCKIPDNGLQLEPKHVAINKLIKELVLCVTYLIPILVRNSWSIDPFK
jgi:hypothetical protein